MLVRKSYRYRLYPTNSQAERLQWVLDRCRELYNAALRERRAAYRMAGVKVSYYAQKRDLPGLKEDCPEFKQVGSQVLQDVPKRVGLAFQAFFRRVRAGDTPGYPRFKSYHRYDSFTYSQAGWKLDDGRLALAGLGALKVRWSRPIQGGCGRSVPKTLSDRWHTCPYEDCGLSLQRDHNSAREILNRAGLARAVAVAPAAESQVL